jgi:hypothetical protein
MIEIPTELVQVQKDVILTMYGMTGNSLKFLTTILKHLFYWTSTTAASYNTTVADVISVFIKGGFAMVEINRDNEFRAAMDKNGESSPIRMNYSNPQEYFPEAEQNNTSTSMLTLLALCTFLLNIDKLLGA